MQHDAKLRPLIRAREFSETFENLLLLKRRDSLKEVFGRRLH
jgi:hypothetical protein